MARRRDCRSRWGSARSWAVYGGCGRDAHLTGRRYSGKVETYIMTAITLDQANRIMAEILKRGAELNLRPLSVIVVEPGCVVKAFQKEDGSSMIRFEMALGKAYAALAMGRSSRLVKVRAEEKPMFMRYLISASGDQIFPEGGGLQIRDEV